MTTPAWSAQENGPTTNLNAVNSANGVNQLLGTHVTQQIGYGKPIVQDLTADQTYFEFGPNQGTSDYAQAFTMSGTAIGRITIPYQIFGNGSDITVTLCPDNSGVPNTAAPIAQVKVPAAMSDITVAPSGLENATSTFQTQWNNTQWGTNLSPTVPWVSPASTVNGAPSFFGLATSGNYTIFVGGQDQTSGNSVANSFSVQYTGSGTVASPIPQTPLPVATHNGMLTVTSDTVVYAGGLQVSATTADVWTASWDSGTGAIGAWSAATALPQATQTGGCASYGEHIYIVGGQTGTTNSTAVSNVWTATVQNSQISSWTATNSLPSATLLPIVAVVGNWLIVTGGQNSSGTYLSNTYYAAINPADGSLGPWQTGPNLQQPIAALAPQWCFGVTTNSIIIHSGVTTGFVTGAFVQILNVTAAGIAPEWNVMAADVQGTRAISAFTDGVGDWYLMGYNTNNTVQQNLFRPVPLMSVPLYATGLTNSAKYWVVIQSVQFSSASDYMGLAMSFNGSTYPATLTSPRNQNTWTTLFPGASVPITVYDTTLAQPIIHVVEDPGTQTPMYQRWGTFTYNNMGLLSGAIEVTMEPNLALNQNPTFTSGTTPWTATNGTLTQSSAQTHGGFAFSGLLTPTGGFTSAYITSELIPLQQYPYFTTGRWFAPTGYFYTPTTWANFALAINWYDSGQNLLSTSTATTSLTGATWTSVTNYFQAPQQASYFAIVPTMAGSPTSSNTLYVSNCYATFTNEQVPAVTSIATVNYGTGSWPPIGVTQLN